MKKIVYVFIFLFFILWGQAVKANEPTVYFFFSETCPHCHKEIQFLQQWQKLDQVKIAAYEVSQNQANAVLLGAVEKQLAIQVRGVPFTLIGNQYAEGYMDELTTGEQIKSIYEQCKQQDCPDIVQQIITGETSANEQINNDKPITQGSQTLERISLPLIGEINLTNFSLPLLTIIIAGLDGFNPCAMWVLVFLIGLLLNLPDKRRRWLLGIVFLIASAGVYFVFMSAWLNLLLFLGFIIWVRLGIALVALGGGGYSIREWWTNRSGACKVTGAPRRQKIFQTLKLITTKQSVWFALGGIILLAFAVNLVELICSAGLPAIYTQVLTLQSLATWQYYLYLLLYILVFLFDDILIFVTAMITLELTGLSTKYARHSHLFGGIIMIIIGLLLLFKPEWLSFA
jgi:thiol-disulfide isomerase/thioredoxin